MVLLVKGFDTNKQIYIYMYIYKFPEYWITRKKIVCMFNIERTLLNKLNIYVYLKHDVTEILLEV